MLATPPLENNPDHARKLWTVDFVLNLLVGHFMFAGYTSLLTIVPSYVLYKGGQEWQLGIIIGSFGIVAMFIRPFSGRWVNKIGAKRVAIVGTAIVAVGSLLYIGAGGPWWLIPIRMIQGIGIAMGPVATSTIVANLAPVNRRAEAMSYMGTSINVSFLYAPLVASLILTHAGYPYAFMFSAVAAALAALLATRISASRIHPAAEGGLDSVSSGVATKPVPLISRAALFPTIVFMTYTFTTAPVNTFLPILAIERSLGNPGLYFTVWSSTSIIAMMVSGPVADRFGRASVIVPGLVLTAVAMFVLNVAYVPLMLWAAGLFAGIGFGLIQPGIQSFTIDRVSPRERSSSMATLQQAWDIAGSGGSFVIGPLGGLMGVANTFGVTGAGALVGALGFIVGYRRKPLARPEGQASLPETAD
ncbi:MAG: MFS transporter [Chloroflexi bacterium]|nr:MFS transporter [Chloroflexota bacterium]MDA1228155.1 MFS transporter [Chloroflexota bacterium]